MSDIDAYLTADLLIFHMVYTSFLYHIREFFVEHIGFGFGHHREPGAFGASIIFFFFGNPLYFVVHII